MPIKPIEVTLSFHMLARLFKGKAVNVNNEVIIIPNPTMLNESEDAEKKCLECDREDLLFERPKVLKGCGNTNPQIRCRQPYCDYCKALKNPHECIDCKDHFSDGQMTISTFSKANKQPQYREPTAEDVGKMVEVFNHLDGEWGKDILIRIDICNKEKRFYTEKISRANGVRNYLGYCALPGYSKARIKVEE